MLSHDMINKYAMARTMTLTLRVLEDEYLHANHKRATAGDTATWYHFLAQEIVVVDIMQQVQEIINA